MKSRALLLVVVLVSWSPAASTAEIEAWPAFRGPNSSGVSDSAKPPVRIGPDENLQWSSDVPGSPSSPCLWGDRIFLTTFAAGGLETRCYERAHGRLVWTRVSPAERLEAYQATEGSPASATPATDGRRVVSYFGSCGLVCHDFAGKELWRYVLPPAVTAGDFGSGTSPLIVGHLVVVNRDQARNSSLLAVNLTTGKKAWESPRPDAPTSYGTPVFWKDGRNAEIVLAGSLTVKGYDPKTGVERWRVRGLPSFTCTTPVIGDGMLFFAGWSPGKADSPWPSWESTLSSMDKNGDGVITLDEFKDKNDAAWFKSQDVNGNGKLDKEDWDTISSLMKQGENVMLAVKLGGSGDVTDAHVAWKFTRGLPYVPSPLFYQGRIYVVKDGGMVSSVDAKSGRPVYAQERINAGGSYYASPVAADGRIYVVSLNGKVTVFKAGGDRPEILHQAEFKERIASTPALAGRQLYLRTARKLYAFGE